MVTGSGAKEGQGALNPESNSEGTDLTFLASE